MYLIIFIDIRFEGNKENCKFNIVTKVTFFFYRVSQKPYKDFVKDLRSYGQVPSNGTINVKNYGNM